MDSYNEITVEDLRSHAEAIGSDRADDDEIGCEPPPAGVGQDERRMQVRAYNHWASMLGSRHFPRIEDLATVERPDFADNAVVLDFSVGIENPAVAMLGPRLADECGAAMTIRHLSDVPGRSLLSRITDHYMQILANQAPIGFEAEFVNHRGKTVIYRGILLPFSSEGETIQQIMGVINWKELADPTTTARLIRELDDGLAVAAAPLDPPLGEWADGPATAEQCGSDTPLPMKADVAEWKLADWLASARELALVAGGVEDRSRAALYAAVDRAWDCALAAQADPAAFRRIVAENGLKHQARAPLSPLVKLVFGAGYDRTRLAEIAAALAHAQRIGVERGAMAALLAHTPGGLKGLVGRERQLRRSAMGRAEAGGAAFEKLAARLRNLPPLPWEDLGADREFALVLVRRTPQGTIHALGQVQQDSSWIVRAGRELLR